jgi:hypothetical protein
MCSSNVGEFLKIFPQNPQGKLIGVACLKKAEKLEAQNFCFEK